MANLNIFDDQSKNDISANNNHIVKLEKLYVKEMSCKIPHAPGLFESTEFKTINGSMTPTIEVSTKVQPVSKNKYEVTLHAIVQGRITNLSLFIVEVQQAGIFVVNVPESQLKNIIEGICVNYLHVYLSQAISNAVIQTGFPPVVLQPLQPVIKQDLTKEQHYSDSKYNDKQEPLNTV